MLEWRDDVIKIDPSISKEPFPSENEIFSTAPAHYQLMADIHAAAVKTQMAVNTAHGALDKNGNITSLNGGVQPFICTIYGPTGSGKSQFIRNLISSQMLDPKPETVFFITPQIGTVPPTERLAWKAQCVEGVFNAKGEPLTSVMEPTFVQLTFDEATTEQNLNVTHPNNVYSKAAQRGPICIVMDECMNQLGSAPPMSAMFHALPSKILGRFPKCTGFYVIVVLHNMNPRQDRGNIKDLKIQSKCHVISPQLETSQITRFIKMYGFGFAPALIPVIKDIVNHARQNSKFSWLVYNNAPINESVRWAYYSPNDQLKPIFMDLQNIYLQTCQDIRRVFKKKYDSRHNYYRRLTQFPY